MFSLTLFKNIKDVKVHRTMTFQTWESFVDLLESLSIQEKCKPEKGSFPKPKDAELISPAIYLNGSSRNNDSVTCWGSWAALDVDENEGSTLSDLISIMKSKENTFFMYSSASSTKSNPKCRVVFPLSREIKKDEIKAFWWALNTEYESLGDKQTKDLSRMYYVPAKYPSSYHFTHHWQNNVIDPSLLMKKHPYRELPSRGDWPRDLKDRVTQYRKEKLSKTCSWTSFEDCPFVPKMLITEYRAITEAGWYSKMYSIMVSIASRAILAEHDITAEEIAQLAKEIDVATGSWYKNRNFIEEASRALKFAYASTL